jgi:hypothetical protein
MSSFKVAGPYPFRIPTRHAAASPSTGLAAGGWLATLQAPPSPPGIDIPAYEVRNGGEVLLR